MVPPAFFLPSTAAVGTMFLKAMSVPHFTKHQRSFALALPFLPRMSCLEGVGSLNLQEARIVGLTGWDES